LGTSDYPPIFTTTSNFTPGVLQLPTHFHNQFQFCTWTLPITLHTFTFTTTLNVTPGNI
jgi:hypothetical protein